jgi:putative inorganic carbon (HCO3(-)) transporter
VPQVSDPPRSAPPHRCRVRNRLVGSIVRLIAAPLLVAVPLGLLAVRNPTASLLVAAGVGALIVVVAQPRIGMLGLVAAGPLETTLQLPGALGTFGLTKPVGLLAVVALAINALVTGRRLRGDTIYPVLVVLGALGLLSAVFSGDPTTGLQTFQRLLSYLLYTVVIIEVTRVDRVHEVLWTFVGAVVLAAVPGLLSVVSRRTYQLSAIYADPNDFAFMMTTALPLALVLAGPLTRRPRARALAAVFAVVLGGSLALSLSRGAIVGLAVGLSLHLVAVPQHRRFLGRTLALVGVGGAAAAVYLAPLLAEAIARKDVVADYNVGSRLDAWRLALDLAASHPVLGVGPGQYGGFYFAGTGTPLSGFGLAVAHNTYLGVLAELGIPVLLCLFLLLVVTWMRLSPRLPAASAAGGRQTQAAHRAAQDLVEEDLVSVFRTTLVIVAVTAAFTSQEYRSPLWLVIGLAATLRPAPAFGAISERRSRTRSGSSQ